MDMVYVKRYTHSPVAYHSSTRHTVLFYVSYIYLVVIYYTSYEVCAFIVCDMWIK